MSETVSRVLFFASLRDAAETDELTLTLDAPTSISGLLDALAAELPSTAMAELRAENVRVAVNQTFVTAAELIQPGDEVAFLPPVTGG
jgi:molybdopterin converting factor subunit 1